MKFTLYDFFLKTELGLYQFDKLLFSLFDEILFYSVVNIQKRKIETKINIQTQEMII